MDLFPGFCSQIILFYYDPNGRILDYFGYFYHWTTIYGVIIQLGIFFRSLIFLLFWRVHYHPLGMYITYSVDDIYIGINFVEQPSFYISSECI